MNEKQETQYNAGGDNNVASCVVGNASIGGVNNGSNKDKDFPVAH
jgi:hypothetical protein